MEFPPIRQEIYSALANYWAQLALVAFISPILFFWVLERFFPAEEGQGLGAVWRNLKVGLVYKLITAGYASVTVLLTGLLMHNLPTALIDLRLATRGWFVLDLAAALLWFLVFDFFYYWFHRAQHRLGWLWQEHRIHHATETLNAAASLSHHWTEDLLRIPVIIVPFSVLFNLNPMAAGLISQLANGWGYFIHANIRLNLGPLNAVIAGPAVHRLHHSIEPRHHDCNFAAFFPVWDLCFGTYVKPEPGHHPRTGVVGYPLPQRLPALLVGPLGLWWAGLRPWLARLPRRLRALPPALGRSVLAPTEGADRTALGLALLAMAVGAVVFALVPVVPARTARFVQEQVEGFGIADSTPLRMATLAFCGCLALGALAWRVVPLAVPVALALPGRALPWLAGLASLALLALQLRSLGVLPRPSLHPEMLWVTWVWLAYAAAAAVLLLGAWLPPAAIFAAIGLGVVLLLQPWAAGTMLHTNAATLPWIDAHLNAMFAGGEMLRFGYRLFAEVPLAYGLLPQVVVAAAGTPPDMGHLVQWLQGFQLVTLALFLLAGWRASRDAPPAARAMLLLLLVMVAAPFLSTGSLAVQFPNQSGLRFIMFPIAALLLVGLQGREFPRWSALAGATAMLALLHNPETGVAVTAGLGLAWLVRARAPSPHPWPLALGCVLAAAAATGLAGMLLFRLVTGAWPLPDTQSGAALAELFAGGFGGLRPSRRIVLLVLFGHAGYVVVRALGVVLGSQRARVDVFSAGIAGIIIAWAPYYANRPHDWNLWVSLVLYVLLLAPLIGLAWRRTGWLGLVLALLVTPIPLAMAMTNQSYQKVVATPGAESGCVAGLALPAAVCADHRARTAELLRAATPGDVLWVTAYSYATLRSTGLRPVMAPLDVFLAVRTEAELAGVAAHIAEVRPLAILVDGGEPGPLRDAVPPPEHALHLRVMARAGYAPCAMVPLRRWDAWLPAGACAEGAEPVRALRARLAGP